MTNKINKTWEEKYTELMAKYRGSDSELKRLYAGLDFIRQELSRARKERILSGFKKGYSKGVLDCEYGQITSEELEEAFRKWWELGPAKCDEDCLGKSELKKKE